MSHFVMSYDLICETAGGDKDKIWQKIMYSKEMGFLMTCLCYHIKLFFDFFEKNGLFNLHIYSILGNFYFFDFIDLMVQASF